MIGIVHNNRMDLSEEADLELVSTNSLFSTGVNQIPMPSSVQGPRHLYGNKFFEQALPMTNREAPLVRNMEDSSGRSWDWKIGEQLGALRAGDDEDQATVELVDPDRIVLKLANGEKREKELYNHFPGNRKTETQSYTKLQKGDVVKAGQTLASTNFTDDEGRMALGLNARIAVAPFKGYSMDDAVVISQSLANRLTSMHAEAIDREPDDDMTLGKQHYVALFPDKFKQEQLDKLDDQGLPLPGTRLEPGDPMILQTRPRQFSSANTDVARLSRNKRFVRKDAAITWDGDYPAEVLDVAKTRDGGNRILVAYESGIEPADKLALRPGQKSTVSLILPDDKMPKTEDGRPVEMLMNELSLPSRENAESFYEMMLGKIARKTGKPYTLPQFLPKGQTWLQFVKDEMEKHGVPDAERLYDPDEDRFLDNPVTVGDAFVMKLHHQAANKMTARGQEGYDLNMQPLKGQGQGAQRLSGLEMTVLQSSGGRGVQKESILLRGQKNDDYWQAVRQNRQPGKLGRPFVFDKFLTLLQGAGVNPADKGKGVLRLTPMTRQILDELDPTEIKSGDLIDLKTFEPKKGGLFDPALVREGKWGYVQLKKPVVNPSYEETVRILLGLTKDEYEQLLDES